jgi:uncharacterized protein with GYD domain
MATYLVRAKYTSSAFTGMLNSPSDRGAAAKAIFAAGGLSTQSIYYEVSNASLVAIVEGTADQMTAVTMVVMSTGVAIEIEATELISTAAMSEAMSVAQGIRNKYAPPNKA